jgi:hypothetical protein
MLQVLFQWFLKAPRNRTPSRIRDKSFNLKVFIVCYCTFVIHSVATEFFCRVGSPLTDVLEFRDVLELAKSARCTIGYSQTNIEFWSLNLRSLGAIFSLKGGEKRCGAQKVFATFSITRPVTIFISSASRYYPIRAERNFFSQFRYNFQKRSNLVIL